MASAYDRYMTENRRFHCLVALASGNRELAEISRNLLHRMTRFLLGVHTGDVIEMIHNRLIEALRSHDAAPARQTILPEVTETQMSTLEHVIQHDGAAWMLGAAAEHDTPQAGPTEIDVSGS